MAVADRDVRRVQKFNRINARPGGIDLRPEESQRELDELFYGWQSEYKRLDRPSAVEVAMVELRERGNSSSYWYIPNRRRDGTIKGLWQLCNYDEKNEEYVSLHWYARPDMIGKLWFRVRDLRDVFWYLFDYMGVDIVFGIKNPWDKRAQQAVEKMGFEDHSVLNYQGDDFTLIYVKEDMLRPVLKDWY